MMKTVGCYSNTYNASIPLAPKEQGCFYGRPTADIHIHARTEPEGKGSYNYTKVIVSSIDDFEWGALIKAVPFTGQELWGMQKDYIDQLPAGGATEKNFREFFASRGFTSFEGNMPAETRRAAEGDPFAAIRNNLAAAVRNPVSRIHSALCDIIASENGRFLLDRVWPSKTKDYPRFDLDIDEVLPDQICCRFDFYEQEETYSTEIPVRWLESEDSLRRASKNYWKQKKDQARLLDKQKTEEAEKERQAQEKYERELYLKLKKKYGGQECHS